MSGSYELKLAKDGPFHFNLLASNGPIIMGSERYRNKAPGLTGIATIRKNCREGGRVRAKGAH